MKQIQYTLLLATLLSATACSNDVLDNGQTTAASDIISFSATLQESAAVETRAFGDNEKGDEVPLPFINGISIRKVWLVSAETKTITPYNVLTGNKGVLQYAGDIADCMKWDKDNKSASVDFYAWTTPTGVAIDKDAKEGTVDFVNGNRYDASTDKDKIDNQAVTPLDVFISASSFGNKYENSPSVTLPFKHVVSKVSIYLRNPDGAHIGKTDNVIDMKDITIEFFSIPQTWEVAQTESGDNKKAFHITKATTSNVGESETGNLELNLKNLYYNGDNGYFTMYLPPLIESLSTNFTQAGDFCVTYGEDGKYYGTLSNIKIGGKDELQAGEHISIVMDLNKNYGVGVGVNIVDWKDPDKEDHIYANPHRGIYSPGGWQILAEYLRDSKNTLPDSLYTLATPSDANSHKTIRLYNNLTLTAEDLGCDLSGLTLDGQGHTITLPAGAKGLFGTVGEDGATTTIKDLRIESGAISGSNGILANTATGGNATTIENCHILSGSITNTAENASENTGGLIGEVTGTNTAISYCSSVASVTGTKNTGGLIGQIASGTSVTLTGCYAQCAVSGTEVEDETSNESNAGGLIGNMAAGKMENCFFFSSEGKGTVTDAEHCGALVGSYAGTITQCFWSIEENSSLKAVGTGTEIKDGSFLLNTITQEEGEGEEKVTVTYKAGRFGSFSDETFTIGKVNIGNTDYSYFIEALRAATTGDNKDWVFVYGKDYPVIKID